MTHDNLSVENPVTPKTQEIVMSGIAPSVLENAIASFKKKVKLLGDKAERYISKEMQYGIDNEGLAAHLLSLRFKRLQYLGKKFFLHKKYKSWAGASPDFMVGKSISGEIKTAYTTRKYLEYLELNTGADLLAYDKKYYYQVQMQMACTGAKKAYFVAFNPKWVDTEKHKKCLHLIEIEKDEKVIAEIDACLILAIEAISQLRKKHKVSFKCG